MKDLLQPILNGILLGGLYAIIAIGLSTIMGIVKIMNFAHGDLMILSSYLCLVFVSSLGLSPFWSFFVILPVMYFIGYLYQRSLLNQVLGKATDPPLIVAFGVSIMIQNILLIVFTPDARTLMTDLGLKTISLAPYLRIPVNYLLDFLIGLVVIFSLYCFFQRSYLGRAIRAAADDEIAAKLMGVNTRRIYAHAMGISILTAAIAGVLVGMTFTFYPHTGSQYLFIAFGVAIIAGLGSMKGTFVGGIILAVAQLFGGHFLGPGYQVVSGHVMLLIVLLVKPKGIFGTV
ncbi:MAG TPA: branched-chain amino acid ABC transporter permease [Thermodesulfobacteriota bacterium]|nr:branched-chain amino acid ABC transporter permease [Thermodesulfobacteriota bacterium]